MTCMNEMYFGLGRNGPCGHTKEEHNADGVCISGACGCRNYNEDDMSEIIDRNEEYIRQNKPLVDQNSPQPLNWMFEIGHELAEAMKREFQAAELQNAKDVALAEFNRQAEADQARMEREARKHIWIKADQLAPGMTIMDRRKDKTYRSKVVALDPRGRLSRHMKIWVNTQGMAGRLGWVYHEGDEVMVLA